MCPPEETFSFWKGIADVGLMGEVVSNIRTELLELLRGVQLRSDQANLQDAGELFFLKHSTVSFAALYVAYLHSIYNVEYNSVLV